MKKIIILFIMVLVIFISCLFIFNDNEKPVIRLNGNKVEQVNNGVYEEKGFVAHDNKDGDITNLVVISGRVDTSKEGVYELRYKVSDKAGNVTVVTRKVIVSQAVKPVSVINENGITYVDGVLLVNKNHSLPEDYNPGVNEEALGALTRLQADSLAAGFDLSLISGYRSYETQRELYNSYVLEVGEEEANTFSAKPGYSEHQTGLAFDLGSVDRSFANTPDAKWLSLNAHTYGFIIRYPEEKQAVTGYIYEPWHVRYLGVELATKVKESGLTLEEYLGVN
ncbi:MAG: D-alanyl-D-alanine carboxypeptidase family protein [Bacilli bacterium]|nr:D-alanyl-D-alanine carboxypeptidase family protein [Bacilli bacterium]